MGFVSRLPEEELLEAREEEPLVAWQPVNGHFTYFFSLVCSSLSVSSISHLFSFKSFLFIDLHIYQCIDLSYVIFCSFCIQSKSLFCRIPCLDQAEL